MSLRDQLLAVRGELQAALEELCAEPSTPEIEETLNELLRCKMRVARALDGLPDLPDRVAGPETIQ
jgi:hypothetical protein